jgi:predicted membrane protein
VVFLALAAIDLVAVSFTDFSLRTSWADRFLIWMVLITGIGVFAFFFKKLSIGLKFYFSVYLLYPVLVGCLFWVDKIMFAIVGSLLFAIVTVPTSFYNEGGYDVRQRLGLIGLPEVELIEKKGLMEKYIGALESEKLARKIYNFEIINQIGDSTITVINRKDTFVFVRL